MESEFTITDHYIERNITHSTCLNVMGPYYKKLIEKHFSEVTKAGKKIMTYEEAIRKLEREANGLTSASKKATYPLKTDPTNPVVDENVPKMKLELERAEYANKITAIKRDITNLQTNIAQSRKNTASDILMACGVEHCVGFSFGEAEMLLDEIMKPVVKRKEILAMSKNTSEVRYGEVVIIFWHVKLCTKKLMKDLSDHAHKLQKKIWAREDAEVLAMETASTKPYDALREELEDLRRMVGPAASPRPGQAFAHAQKRRGARVTGPPRSGWKPKHGKKPSRGGPRKSDAGQRGPPTPRKTNQGRNRKRTPGAAVRPGDPPNGGMRPSRRFYRTRPNTPTAGNKGQPVSRRRPSKNGQRAAPLAARN